MRPWTPLGFVATTRPVTTAEIKAALGPAWASALLIPNKSAADGPVLLQRPQGSIGIMLIDKPYPAQPLMEDPAQKLAWPGLAAARATWRGHLIVTSLATCTQLADCRSATEALLKTLSALAVRPFASAVAVASSGLFHKAADFAQRCREEPLPVDMLVHCMFQRDGAGRLVVQTRGLAAFGLPELQKTAGSNEPDAGTNLLLNVASYLLANGPVIADGDTIDGTDGKKLVARTVTTPTGMSVLRFAPPSR